MALNRKRIEELEARVAARTFTVVWTEDQERAWSRWMALAVAGREIPRRLQQQVRKLPPRIAMHPSIERIWEASRADASKFKRAGMKSSEGVEHEVN